MSLKIQERAYYLHTHRAMEDRFPNPLGDWLNAQWIENNQSTYWLLEEAVKKALRRAYAMPEGVKLNHDTKLPWDERAYDTAVPAIGMAARKIGLTIENIGVETAFSISKTYAGFMEQLVTRIRCAEDRKTS